jgi:hypothetical protein
MERSRRVCFAMLAILLAPVIAHAAEPKSGGETLVAIPGSQSSGSLPVVIRGAPATSTAPSQAPTVRNRTPANTGVAPLYGQGWNNDYNYNGLNYSQ